MIVCFLFKGVLFVLRIGYIILLWHSLRLSYFFSMKQIKHDIIQLYIESDGKRKCLNEASLLSI